MAEKEYIERGAFAERLQDFSEWCREGRKQGVDFVLDCPLPNTPTAGVVEVVQCKDCKHWRHETAGMIDHYECNVFCDCYGRGYLTNADDFCSYGERKEQQ